jgi:hypothetical protein
MNPTRTLTSLLFICFLSLALSAVPWLESSELELLQEDKDGILSVLIDGRTAFVYHYSNWYDLVHIYPLYSPAGQNLLLQQGKPYPHHRAFYFADTVRLDGGRQVSVYNALYTGQRIGEDAFGPPFRDSIRHVEFSRLETEESRAIIEARLVWAMDGQKPVLDEKRQYVVYALGEGEYLIDVVTVLTAAYGEVEFVSDEVHYAWPFLRLNPRFSGENGGTITADNGAKGEEATNMKEALWVDYSNTVDGVTEGVAVFQWPDGQEHCWLTREYGIFGPRRPLARSGKPFVLKKGESLTQRVGVLVHRGDVRTGRVSQRYRRYIKGNRER